MSKKLNLKHFLSLLFLTVLTISFYSCVQKEDVKLPSENQQIEKSLFQQHLADQTQNIEANDLGEGKYSVTGEQGTRIEIDNGLVDGSGNRVRGTIDIVLIEIYSVADMILNRKQTLADYDGQLKMLESGGEIFVKAYQNGEELFADGNGSMNMFLPTENTGGAKEDMELYYGEEIGAQIIWKPTGQKIRVISNESREEESEYLVMIQDILGWINVDKIYSLEGEPVECITVKIDCEDLCTGTTVVAMHIQDLNSAFGLTHIGDNKYEICGGEEGAFPLGGIEVTFVIVIDCGGGEVQVATVTTVISPDNHGTTVKCGDLRYMRADELEHILIELAE